MDIDFESIARSVAEAIDRTGNAKAIFGEPIKLETRTIVPVVAVTVRVGGGGGHIFGGKRVKETAAKDSPFGGGGGGGSLMIHPLGYIHEKDGEVTFTAISPPVAEFERIVDTRLEDAPTGVVRAVLRKWRRRSE